MSGGIGGKRKRKFILPSWSEAYVDLKPVVKPGVKSGVKRKLKLHGRERYAGKMEHLSLLLHWSILESLRRAKDYGSIPAPDGKRYSIPSLSFLIECLVSKHIKGYMIEPTADYAPDDGAMLVTHAGATDIETIGRLAKPEDDVF